MTRVAIIQRLLDLRQITAQEAVTLLEREYYYQPYYYNNPWPGVILTSGTFNNVSAGRTVTSSYVPGTTTTYTGEQLNLFTDATNKS